LLSPCFNSPLHSYYRYDFQALQLEKVSKSRNYKKLPTTVIAIITILIFAVVVLIVVVFLSSGTKEQNKSFTNDSNIKQTNGKGPSAWS